MISKYLNKITCIDCLDLMKDLPDNCIDTIITDPPYGLRFMGKKWDYELPSIEVFKEMYRVAKPGTTLMCFGGTRTYHRLTCNIEDAGWEIRDCMMWLYGSGFPKSLDISKAIDMKLGFTGKIIGKTGTLYHDFKKHVGSMMSDHNKKQKEALNITEPSSKEAKEWEGYGTSLKPAWEPIIIAMKPVEDNFASNALKYGVAGLNIDEGRIPFEEADREEYIATERRFSKGKAVDTYFGKKKGDSELKIKNSEKGRWPANLVLNEEAAKLLDEQSGVLTTGAKSSNHNIKQDIGNHIIKVKKRYWLDKEKDSGGASRFFYTPKPSVSERNCGDSVDLPKKGKVFNGQSDKQASKLPGSVEDKFSPNPQGNYHPTVKPLKLIEYLCKLTKPPKGGIVLDPFAGSCTTAIACRNTDRNYICCDLDEEYCKIGIKRLSYGPLFS